MEMFLLYRHLAEEFPRLQDAFPPNRKMDCDWQVAESPKWQTCVGFEADQYSCGSLDEFDLARF
jgi:hypothetical protein